MHICVTLFGKFNSITSGRLTENFIPSKLNLAIFQSKFLGISLSVENFFPYPDKFFSVLVLILIMYQNVQKFMKPSVKPIRDSVLYIKLQDIESNALWKSNIISSPGIWIFSV